MRLRSELRRVGWALTGFAVLVASPGFALAAAHEGAAEGTGAPRPASIYTLPEAIRLELEVPAEEPPSESAPLALANPYALAPTAQVRISGGKSDEKKPPRRSRSRSSRRMPNLALTPERAQALLRSLTVPGWGQATLGHRTSATIFGILETGVWGSFTAFRIQEHLRRESSARTARIFAGVDLSGRDEEFLRLVGAFASSDEYNLLVVTRDAANLYYDEPERYRDYIATHSLKGGDRWTWQDEASFLRYRAQRKDAQRAELRANTALAVAVGNRILSMLHVARAAGRKSAASETPRSWNFEVRPAGGDDPTAYHFGLRATF